MDFLSKRRWLRFSLRSLLIAMTLLSVAFGLVFNSAQNERRAAEAVQAANGDIVYDWQIRPTDANPNFQPQPPGPLWLRKYLGWHWFDRIVEVRLNGYANRSDQNRFAVVGPHLVKLQSLRSLMLWGGELHSADYRTLGQLGQLEELNFRQEKEIRPQDTAQMARMASLRELHLGDAKISPTALNELAKLPDLELLQIDCSAYDLQTGRMQKEYQLRDEAAEVLATFPQLRTLMLFATQITDEGISALSRLAQLETLVVSSPNITSSSFEHVAKLKRLEHLGTWQWKIADADLEKLSAPPKLKSLALVTTLTDTSVPHLTRLDQIERLSLRGEEITDASLHHLHDLRKLVWLDLEDTSITKYGPEAKELKQRFPNCAIILPPTEEEKARKRAFLDWKWGGGANAN